MFLTCSCYFPDSVSISKYIKNDFLVSHHIKDVPEKTYSPRWRPKHSSSVLLLVGHICTMYFSTKANTRGKVLVLVLDSSYYFYTVFILVAVAVAHTSLSLAVSSWLGRHAFSAHIHSPFSPDYWVEQHCRVTAKSSWFIPCVCMGPALLGFSSSWRTPSLLCANSCQLALSRGSKSLLSSALLL